MRSSQRSASSAAAHPEPAAVMAWRYLRSTTSPHAKTPGTLHWVLNPGCAWTMYSSSSSISCPLKRRDCDSWPMATNAAAQGMICVSPVFKLSTSAPVSPLSSLIQRLTWQKVTIFTLGSRCARFCMMACALKTSLRCIKVMDFANRARKSASSKATSPPPTTRTSSSKQSAASQVAHVETPRPFTCSSPSTPSHFAEAPVEMTSASVSMMCPCSFSLEGTRTRKGRTERSTAVTVCSRTSAPNFSACLRRSSIRVGPPTASV
mmetsp:Transcript_19988/g.52418  ORF Transcript_19988/g.52418 Transcript_19988/m.52418 type:complete len:263 (+) Transcript_19988:204-992(+)